MTTPMPLGRAAAETLALRALAWLAEDRERTDRFLAVTGAAAHDLRDRADDPEFLGFVLDFLLSDEPALVAFAASCGIRPDLPMRARAGLPGGDLPNWT